MMETNFLSKNIDVVFEMIRVAPAAVPAAI